MTLVHDLTVGSVVVVGERLRPLSEPAVAELVESMRTVGQVQPITVYRPKGIPRLVTGRHRLEAAKRLGWETVACVILPDGTTAETVEMMEIAENLHRAELTALQRSEQITRWIELQKLGQVAQVSGGRGNEGGISAACRTLGVERTEARRAVKVASLSDDAKSAAAEVGLDDNRTALLSAAKKPTVGEQVAEIHRLASEKRKPREAKLADEPLNDFEANERQVAALVSAWNRASPEARQQFLDRIDRPVMDARYG